ncbi:flavodoxin family protein [Amycolatopsis pithecellobii]|uniref:Flavodoxin n=1 Tax=Amycolatopsis pithecellobii TaxID=664692 RepID=A0A6N7ZBR4_9PSEU|nr:flavodoxin domain-containing protein [Amycolatopsis pithecellobii]MTD59193.1 flavodoxin [Amycolatopsis pithecellobii]
MRALVVYESMFTNTEKVAKAIVEGLGADVSAEVVNVDDAPDELAGVDLLVVGGPTHVHGMTRPSTRKAAAEQATGDVRSHIGVREWLATLKSPPAALCAAAFDTRLNKPRWLTGSAARGVAKELKRSRIKLVTAPQSFYVTGATPPELADGECARARDWGSALATEVSG